MHPDGAFLEETFNVYALEKKHCFKFLIIQYEKIKRAFILKFA